MGRPNYFVGRQFDGIAREETKMYGNSRDGTWGWPPEAGPFLWQEELSDTDTIKVRIWRGPKYKTEMPQELPDTIANLDSFMVYQNQIAYARELSNILSGLTKDTFESELLMPDVT